MLPSIRDKEGKKKFFLAVGWVYISYYVMIGGCKVQTLVLVNSLSQQKA